MEERLGIAGSGAIACGLAATAARSGEVLLWARSPESAKRAHATISRHCAKLLAGEVDPDHVKIVRDLDGLHSATFLVEAVVEHHGMKSEILAELGELSKHAEPNAILATTTSSLSIAELAQASGHPERFVGFHPFNPVPRMKLIELAFPAEADEETRARARALAEAIGKTPVHAPDSPGFVNKRRNFVQGCQDDAGLPVRPKHFTGSFQPVAFRHHKVHQNDIRGQVSGEQHGLTT